MAVTDFAAQALSWALDEAQKQCFTEDYTVAVFPMAQPVPGPNGPMLIPVWVLSLTGRNPLLGEGPLHHTVPVGRPPYPSEDEVRNAVAEGVRALRDLAASKLSGLNGGPKIPLAGQR